VAVVLFALVPGRVPADEAPIAGVVRSVDAQAQTFVVEAATKGTTRQVTIYMRPTSRVVRFVRADQGRGGLVEQAAALADLKPGWMVSVTTVHEGEREVAEIVRIVFER
jgi:hypothetical protein